MRMTRLAAKIKYLDGSQLGLGQRSLVMHFRRCNTTGTHMIKGFLRGR